MWVDDYHWHYDYARLAWDTGFCFDKFKYPNLDKNKICLIDIDRIIKERDIASVERNISTVVQYILENDQAEVLDTNFVKLFRLSQLSVEYLLFCKKYLDKTVVLLKREANHLKEEIKDLKNYVEELESNVPASRNGSITASKCGICSKIFPTEEYLNSHLKRRHNGDENRISNNSEAEKLHSEIKQLKERLNNTEKFIHEKPCEETDNFKSHFKEDNKDVDDRSTKLVNEIQESFEKFRKQVDEKMSSLHLEKTFFTDKYDKLFDIVLQFKHIEPEVSKIEENKISQVEPEKRENSTQINESPSKKDKVKNLHIYTVHCDNIVDDKNENENALVQAQNIDDKIERKLSSFEETIESKISTGLDQIENQIQAFWEKLMETDFLNPSKICKDSVEVNMEQSVMETFPQNKPKIKPRTKLTKPTIKNSETQNINAEIIKSELEKILAEKNKSVPELEGVKSHVRFEHKSELKPTIVKSAVSKIYESTTEEDVSVKEETNNLNRKEYNKPHSGDNITFVKSKDLPITKKSKHAPDKEKNLPFKKPKQSILKSNLPLKGYSPTRKIVSDNRKVKKKIRNQLNDLVNDSLQEMGISPYWKGIPKKTFERALEIVNHQADLNKKSLPNYDSLKKIIAKSLKNDKEMKKVKVKGQPIITRDSPNRKISKHNVIKLQIRKFEPPEPESKPASAITIKNRSLYDSESDTDIKPYLPKKFDHEKIHNAVIEELQSKFAENKSQDTDSDLNSIILSNEDVKETKSALKSIVSEGLVKKKVIFDMEDLEKDLEEKEDEDE